MARINTVAPWEGELIWKGELRTGTTNTGHPWKSVDFAIKYTDKRGDERKIAFSLFGDAKVDIFMQYPIGTMLRVTWWPEANYSQSTGKYYYKNSVISVGNINGASQESVEQEPGEDPDGDMPF